MVLGKGGTGKLGLGCFGGRLFRGILARRLSLKLPVRSPGIALGWGSGARLGRGMGTVVRMEGAFGKFWRRSDWARHRIRGPPWSIFN